MNPTEQRLATMVPVRCGALLDVCDILKTESNELAHLLDSKKFDGMNYRVDIAVAREMKRLRDLAEELKVNIPDEEYSED